MALRSRLVQSYLARHPVEGALLLEALPVGDVAPVISGLDPADAASVVHAMASGVAGLLLEEIEPTVAAAILAELPLEVAAALLRQAPDATRDRLVTAMPEEKADELQAVIAWPSHTAGAIMDPRAIALPGDLTVEAALDAVKREARHALYNLYVTDRDGVLVGVLNLQELLHARAASKLEVVAGAATHRIPVNADHRHVLEHAGWREVTSLPVVDASGRFLGAVRYRALRRLEHDLLDPDRGADDLAPGALGALFRTGLVGAISAVSGEGPVRGEPVPAGRAPGDRGPADRPRVPGEKGR